MCGGGHAPILTRLCLRRGPPGGRGCRRGTKGDASDQDQHRRAERRAESARHTSEPAGAVRLPMSSYLREFCLGYLIPLDHEAAEMRNRGLAATIPEKVQNSCAVRLSCVLFIE